MGLSPAANFLVEGKITSLPSGDIITFYSEFNGNIDVREFDLQIIILSAKLVKTSIKNWGNYSSINTLLLNEWVELYINEYLQIHPYIAFTHNISFDHSCENMDSYAITEGVIITCAHHLDVVKGEGVKTNLNFLK